MVEKFQQYFVKRRNVIYERSKFNQWVQAQDETINAFITALYALAETCNYGKLTDEMIRDQVVVGIHDDVVAERLQMNSELTLEKAIQIARQSKALKLQQAVIGSQQQEQPTTLVDYVDSRSSRHLQTTKF